MVISLLKRSENGFELEYEKIASELPRQKVRIMSRLS